MQNSDDKKVSSRSAFVSAGSTIIIIAFFAIAALVLLSAGTKEYESIVLAAKKLGLSPKADKGSHPAFWSENEGRVLVAWDGPKEVLIQKVAQNLKAAEK